MKQTPDWSYTRHRENEHAVVEQKRVPSCYLNPGSIDAWRHRRMYSTLLPLVDQCPEATWLTIGDGRYGSDAHFLQSRGVDVVASSLTDATLKEARECGYIERYRVENAEELNLPDDSFDFILCKESYHHFPRPAIAFYEMLRVSRLAVVMIEPIEPKGISRHLKNAAKIVFRRDKSLKFEPCGNFLYRVNLDEIKKMMTAMNFEYTAFKPFNDFYHSSLAKHQYATLSLATAITRLGLTIQDALCVLRLLGYGLAAIILPKRLPLNRIQGRLKKDGYEVVQLPKNPYLKG